MTNQQIQLTLTLDPDSSLDSEGLQNLTLQLREEILELDVEDAKLGRLATAPDGSKVVEPFSLGTIVVTLLAAGGVITTLINAIQSWLTRHDRRSITLEIDGDKLQITGISSEEQQRLTNLWLQRHPELTQSSDSHHG